jgi:hypothetical protein
MSALLPAMPRGRGARVLVASLLALVFGWGQAAGAAETKPPQAKHGGILEFAVDAEPANYDCDAGISRSPSYIRSRCII